MDDIHNLMSSVCDTNSIEELDKIMANHFSRIGFDKYAYVLVNHPANQSLNNSYVSNFPTEWEKQYTANNYFTVDPLYDLFKSNNTGFFWSWERQKEFLNAVQKKFFLEANDFGIDHGVGIPIKTPHGGLAIMSLCTKDIPQKDMELYLKQQNKDLLIASLIHHQATLALKMPVKKSQNYNLTDKEHEVLYWLCLNKTYDDIAEIIGIKREGVSERLRKVYRKMSAVGRIDAVKKAISSGLVTLVRIVVPFYLLADCILT